MDPTICCYHNFTRISNRIIFSWVFDKTPEGFIKTDAVKSKVNKNTETQQHPNPFI